MDNISSRQTPAFSARTISIGGDHNDEINMFEDTDATYNQNSIADFDLIGNMPTDRHERNNKSENKNTDITGENYFNKGCENYDNDNSVQDGHGGSSLSDNESEDNESASRPHIKTPAYQFPQVEDDVVSVSSSNATAKNTKQMYEEIQKEKQKLLFGLEKYRRRGVKLTRSFTMASDIEDIRYEYQHIKRERDVENSIKFQRKVLLALVGGAEYVNEKFDPIGAHLDGWSENIMEDIENYDEVFEELHDKYAEKISMAPEIKLIAMIGGSALMYHMSRSLLDGNGIKDMLRNNPELAKSIATAVANSNPNNPVATMMQQGVDMNINAGAMRRKMAAPVPSSNDVDDVINDLNNVSNTSYGRTPPPPVETKMTKTGRPVIEDSQQRQPRVANKQTVSKNKRRKDADSILNVDI